MIPVDKVQQLSTAIAWLYRTPFGQSAWEPALEHVCRLFDAEAAFLRLTDGNARSDDFVLSHGYSADDLRDYSENYAHEDLWTIQGVPKIDGRRVLVGDELAPRHEIERTGMLNDFLKPRGVSDCLVIPIDVRNGRHSVLVVNGRGENGRFSRDQMFLADSLRPHVINAARDSEALTDSRRAEGDVVDSQIACANFGHDGRIERCNDAFLVLARTLNLFTKFQSPALDTLRQEIRTLVDDVVRRSETATIVAQDKSGAEFAIRIIASGQWRVTILILPLEARARASAHACAVAWALTNRERDVLARVVVGNGACQIAEQLGVTKETVRSHLKSIYFKSSTNSLTALAAAAARIEF